jgi:hypothetical protein
MKNNHSVKMRAPFNSPFNELNGINLNELNLNWNWNSTDIANWNQNLLESESEPEYLFQRKTKSKKQKKKHFSQLFRLCSYLKNFIDSDAKVESFNSKIKSPWEKSAILTEIDSNFKEIAASNHRVKIASLQQNHHENIIIYCDGFKLSEEKIGAGSYISYSQHEQQSYSWKLNSKIEVFDSELFAMLKSLYLAKQKINSTVKNI